MSRCPVLLSANRHGCVAGWITRWPFHLRNHNLNPAGSHQRINGQRHSYFKVIKHYTKGKGGTYFFKPWFWPPIQLASLVLLLQTGTRIQNWRTPSTSPPDLRIWRRPTTTARQTFPHKSVRRTASRCWDSDGWLNGTYSAWTQAAGRDASTDTRGS